MPHGSTVRLFAPPVPDYHTQRTASTQEDSAYLTLESHYKVYKRRTTVYVD